MSGYFSTPCVLVCGDRELPALLTVRAHPLRTLVEPLRIQVDEADMDRLLSKLDRVKGS